MLFATVTNNIALESSLACLSRAVHINHDFTPRSLHLRIPLATSTRLESSLPNLSYLSAGLRRQWGPFLSRSRMCDDHCLSLALFY